MSETIKMRKRTYWTTETFKEEMKKRNHNIEIYGEYVNSKVKIKCMCLIDEYVWEAIPSKLLEGRGCPKCSGKVSKTKEEFLQEFYLNNYHANNIIFMSDYIDSSTRIHCKCKIDNHEWYSLPNNLLKGHGCKKCSITKLSDKRRKTHKEFLEEFYENNENANNLEILGKYIESKEPIKTKCKIDGYVWYPSADSLIHNHGCPVCGHTITVTGINDIATTNPELVKYFSNEQDANIVCRNSNKEILFICPDCKTTRKMKVSEFYKNGIRCRMCSSKESYPNKFSRVFLSQLPIDNFIPEYSPDWIKPKRYDNYFEYEGQSYVLEMDGLFHYKDNNYKKQSVSETIKNDIYKQKEAEKRGIKVIRIDCKYPNFEYIKKNLLSSELSRIFDLSIINWKLCEKNSINVKNKLLDICDYYNNITQDFNVISNHFGITKQQIRKYVKRGYYLGLTDYSPEKILESRSKIAEHHLAKPVNVFNDNKLIHTFSSIKECSNKMKEIYNCYFKSSKISECCKNKSSEYKGFNFMFV